MSSSPKPLRFVPYEPNKRTTRRLRRKDGERGGTGDAGCAVSSSSQVVPTCPRLTTSERPETGGPSASIHLVEAPEGVGTMSGLVNIGELCMFGSCWGRMVTLVT